MESIPLKGTKWKLAGIVDKETGTLKVLEPKECEECFTLTFDTDYTATVRSINKETINLDLLNLNPDRLLAKNGWWEIYDGDGQSYFDGDPFRRAILTTASYSVTGDELNLFNKAFYLLLFKQIKL